MSEAANALESTGGTTVYPVAQGTSEDFKCSESLSKLVEALTNAQKEFKPIVKGVLNEFFTTDTKKSKYADLAELLNATRPALSANGLAIIQLPITKLEEKKAGCCTRMVHTSGEWVQLTLLLPATAKMKEYDAAGKWTWVQKVDAQTCGIAITYSRRFSYQAIINVAGENEDDANMISQQEPGSKEAAKDVAKKKMKEAGVTEKDLGKLYYQWFDESQTGKVIGGSEIKEAHKDLLRPFWDANVGAIVVNAEQLDSLKWELEQRKVPFEPLKSDAKVKKAVG